MYVLCTVTAPYRPVICMVGRCGRCGSRLITVALMAIVRTLCLYLSEGQTQAHIRHHEHFKRSNEVRSVTTGGDPLLVFLLCWLNWHSDSRKCQDSVLIGQEIVKDGACFNVHVHARSLSFKTAALNCKLALSNKPVTILLNNCKTPVAVLLLLFCFFNHVMDSLSKNCLLETQKGHRLYRSEAEYKSSFTNQALQSYLSFLDKNKCESIFLYHFNCLPYLTEFISFCLF